MSSIKFERLYRLVKEATWIAVGQILSVCGSLLLVGVLTEYLDPRQFGQLALALTVAGLINQVVMGGIGVGISRYYSIANEKDDLSQYMVDSGLVLIYGTIVVIIIGIALISGLWSLGYTEWIGLSIAALIFSVLAGYNNAINGIQNAARQRICVAFHSVLDSWLKIGLAIVFMQWLGKSSIVIVIGYSLSLILIMVSQCFFLRRNFVFKINTNENNSVWSKKMLLYSLPFATWGVFAWMQQASDRWALQTYASTIEVGQYTVLFQLGYTPIAMITGLVMSFLGPILYNQSGDATDPLRNTYVHRFTWKLTQFALMMTMVAFFLALALHDWLFSFLVSIQYREISYLLPWVILAGGFFAAGQALTLKLMSEMKATAMTTAKISTALFGVVCNFIGAAFAGLHGVVGGLIFFSIIYLVWMSFLAIKNPRVLGS